MQKPGEELLKGINAQNVHFSQTTERFKIYDPACRRSKSTSPSCSTASKTFQDGHGVITTGVTTWGLKGSVGVSSKNDTTWSATQVCRRRVESGLGGHEAGVWRVDEGSRTHRSGYENGDEWPRQIVGPSAVLVVLKMIMSARNENESTARLHMK